jgi:hypothetical protein
MRCRSDIIYIYRTTTYEPDQLNNGLTNLAFRTAAVGSPFLLLGRASWPNSTVSAEEEQICPVLVDLRSTDCLTGRSSVITDLRPHVRNLPEKLSHAFVGLYQLYIAAVANLRCGARTATEINAQ